MNVLRFSLTILSFINFSMKCYFKENLIERLSNGAESQGLEKSPVD